MDLVTCCNPGASSAPLALHAFPPLSTKSDFEKTVGLCQPDETCHAKQQNEAYGTRTFKRYPIIQ